MTDLITEGLQTFIAAKILKQAGRVIAPDAALISVGLIDSFSLVDLALFVEEAYGVHLDDTELNSEAFDSIQQLAALVRARKPE